MKPRFSCWKRWLIFRNDISDCCSIISSILFISVCHGSKLILTGWGKNQNKTNDIEVRIRNLSWIGYGWVWLCRHRWFSLRENVMFSEILIENRSKVNFNAVTTQNHGIFGMHQTNKPKYCTLVLEFTGTDSALHLQRQIKIDLHNQSNFKWLQVKCFPDCGNVVTKFSVFGPS